MEHILNKEECFSLKDDNLFDNTVLIYAFGGLMLRNQIMEESKVEKIPAPIFSEFIEAIEKKSNQSIYYYCKNNRIGFPKTIKDIYKIYINIGTEK